MKRMVKITFILFIICSLPLTAVKAQEGKNKQHIKVVVVDESGSQTEIDTLFSNSSMPDSIMLRNGKMIRISKDGKIAETMCHREGCGSDMLITLNSEKGGKNKIVKKIIITAGDSTKSSGSNEDDCVVVVKKGKHFVEGKGADVMYWSSDKKGTERGNVIYINEDEDKLKKEEKTIDVEVRTDDSGKTVEKTKYVLAKDGMVISIEGNDEAKVKDLVKDIESKMGVKETGTDPKTVAKEVMKNTQKK